MLILYNNIIYLFLYLKLFIDDFYTRNNFIIIISIKMLSYNLLLTITKLCRHYLNSIYIFLNITFEIKKKILSDK